MKQRNGRADDWHGDGRNQEDRFAASRATAMPGEAFAMAGVNSRHGSGQVIAGTRVLRNFHGPVEACTKITHFVPPGELDSAEFEY